MVGDETDGIWPAIAGWATRVNVTTTAFSIITPSFDAGVEGLAEGNPTTTPATGL